jgi:hypothetical protein
MRRLKCAQCPNEYVCAWLLIRPKGFASCSPTLATKTKASQGWGTQTVLQYIRAESITDGNAFDLWHPDSMKCESIREWMRASALRSSTRGNGSRLRALLKTLTFAISFLRPCSHTLILSIRGKSNLTVKADCARPSKGGFDLSIERLIHASVIVHSIHLLLADGPLASNALSARQRKQEQESERESLM